MEILKGNGIAAEVVATKTFNQGSVEWRHTVVDADAKYFYVRISNATGGDTRIANPANPVAWLAPVWTGR